MNKVIAERTPLTEEEILSYFDAKIEKEAKMWGENDYYTNLARRNKDEKMNDYRSGKVIAVYSEEYRNNYGNGLGDFADTLFSDGHVETTCYGYSD